MRLAASLTVLCAFALCAFALLLVPSAFADWPHDVKWDQLEPISRDAGWSQIDVQVTADDFFCDETGWITDIEFIGDPYAQVTGAATLRITFWSDVPATGSDESHPGQLLRDITVGPADPADPLGIGWHEDPDYVWQFTESKYKINLAQDDWFLQEAGNIYWIGIQGPPGFMWQALDRTAGSSLDDGAYLAVGTTTWEHYGWEPPNWNLTRYTGRLLDGWVSADFSFRLTGTAIPEPATLTVVTIGIALIGLLGRRKRS